MSLAMTTRRRGAGPDGWAAGSRAPRLDAAAEHELAGRIAAGDPEARDAMVRANLPLVLTIARDFAGRGLERDDLVAEGCLGLMHAVERFDPGFGARFSTYAAHWIKQSMRGAIERQARAIRLPFYLHRLLPRWRRAATELEARLGRPATAGEVGEELGLTPRRARCMAEALEALAASGGPPAGGGSGEAPERAVADAGPSPEGEASRSEELGLLAGRLGYLDERSRRLLELRYGLRGERPLTHAGVGERLGLTRQRVCQLEREALARLRDSG